MRKKFLIIVFFIFSFSSYADDIDDAKNNVIKKFGNSISTALEGFIGGSGGDTEVNITAGEDYFPEFSIMTVRPLSIHPEVDAWFIQLQLNETKISGADPSLNDTGRLSINTGIGYRKLSKGKNSFTGGNVFLDYDEEGNSRASIGLEFRASAFEAIANYYTGLSGSTTVGSYTERVLDGYEVSLVGEVPYLPWANLIANHYEWEAEKNTKDSKGDKISLELTLTPNLIIEGGADDNNIDGTNNFIKAYLVYPAREQRAAASTNFISDTAFSDVDMSSQLLSKVRRTNKIIIESEGTGVVIGRASN